MASFLQNNKKECYFEAREITN